MNKSLQQLLSLKGKTAVVTGGAGYLGTAISETLAELGANLILASRDQEKCQKECDELLRLTGGSIQAVALELDVLNRDSAAEFS
jgi:gluconate 5-dehydrogenase